MVDTTDERKQMAGKRTRRQKKREPINLPNCRAELVSWLRDALRACPSIFSPVFATECSSCWRHRHHALFLPLSVASEEHRLPVMAMSPRGALPLKRTCHTEFQDVPD